jgi:hypothetical protein
MLLVSDPVTRDFTISRRRASNLHGQDEEDEAKDKRFASLCKSLCDTNSWENFQSFGRQALAEGMFLSVEDFESSIGSDFAYETRTVPVMLTVRVSCGVVAPMRSSDRIRLQVRIPNKTQDESNPFMVPFVKYLTSNSNEEDEKDLFSLSTFVGYNVQDSDDGILTCQLPLSFAWWELMLLLEDYGLSEQLADSFLPLDWLWRNCQEHCVTEGVAIVDRLLPKRLHADLMAQTDAITLRPEMI